MHMHVQTLYTYDCFSYFLAILSPSIFYFGAFTLDIEVLIVVFLTLSFFVYLKLSLIYVFQLCSLQAIVKRVGGAGVTLAPIPACKEDFSRMKLTSFDKLIERTCSLIKNVRLCSEPDLRQGAGTGNSSVAPDAA